MDEFCKTKYMNWQTYFNRILLQKAITTLCKDGVTKKLFIAYIEFEGEQKRNGGFSSQHLVPK